jgi:hypothetical protein
LVQQCHQIIFNASGNKRLFIFLLSISVFPFPSSQHHQSYGWMDCNNGGAKALTRRPERPFVFDSKTHYFHWNRPQWSFKLLLPPIYTSFWVFDNFTKFISKRENLNFFPSNCFKITRYLPNFPIMAFPILLSALCTTILVKLYFIATLNISVFRRSVTYDLKDKTSANISSDCSYIDVRQAKKDHFRKRSWV